MELNRVVARIRTRLVAPDEAERLRQEAVREFASRVAHQLGNLLQAMNGNIELIAQRTTDKTTLNYLANVRAAAEQLTELTHRLQTTPPD